MNKAYFTASIKGKKYYLGEYQKIIGLIKAHKYDVISDHIINNSESSVNLESPQERIEFHKKLENWIKESDFVVIEASFPSISVGYEIALANFHKKPILILHKEGTKPPTIIATDEKENIVCEEYNDETLNNIIEEFINYIKDSHESRFTFFITPDINFHLEKMSLQNRIPKSVYLRQLIEKDMQNNS